MGKNHRVVMVWCGCAVFVVLTHGRVYASLKTPLETVREVGVRAEAIMNNPRMAPQEKQRQIRDIILPYFDTREMVKRALGIYWRSNQDREKEFASLFVALLQKAYLHTANLNLASGAKITYLSQRIDRDDDAFATVFTKLDTNKIKDIPIAYRLRLKSGEWKIYDVLVEGNSLIGNYRAQFYKILSHATFDELLAEMRERIAEPDAKDKR